MADVLAGGGLVEGDHREAGGLGFEDHVAEVSDRLGKRNRSPEA